MSVKARLAALSAKIEALSRRERAMLVATLLASVYGLWDLLLMQPLTEQEKVIEQQIISTQGQLEQLDTQIATMAARQTRDPNRDERRRLEALQNQTRQLDQKITSLGSDLISPAQMPHLLRRLAAEAEGLELLRLANRPVEPILDAAGSSASGADLPNLYRHTVELEVEGDFPTTLAYLRALAGLPYRFYWDRLAYRVQEYPRARVTLTLYTFSLQEAWIGV